MHVKARVDQGRNSRLVAVCFEDVVISGVLLTVNDLWTRGSIHVDDRWRRFLHLVRTIEGDRHELSSELGASEISIAFVHSLAQGDRREGHELVAVQPRVQPIVDACVYGRIKTRTVAQSSRPELHSTVEMSHDVALDQKTCDALRNIVRSFPTDRIVPQDILDTSIVVRGTPIHIVDGSGAHVSGFLPIDGLAGPVAEPTVSHMGEHENVANSRYLVDPLIELDVGDHAASQHHLAQPCRPDIVAYEPFGYFLEHDLEGSGQLFSAVTPMPIQQPGIIAIDGRHSESPSFRVPEGQRAHFVQKIRVWRAKGSQSRDLTLVLGRLKTQSLRHCGVKGSQAVRHQHFRQHLELPRRTL